MVSLEEAILVYKEALKNFPRKKVEDAESKVMSVLVARDHVAHVLSNNQPCTAKALIYINKLDQELKNSAARIDDIIEQPTLANWRELVQASPSAWWWYLDERAFADSKFNLLWAILAGFFITVSLSLIAEVSRRFLSVGADFLSIFSTISSVLLALLAGSTLIEAGRKTVERVLSRLGIKRTFQPKWEAGLAFTVLFLVLVLRLSLPAIARYYNDTGAHLQHLGQVTSAMAHFQRAISLNPDYAQAHYNLANAYEDILEHDKALSEYQTAIQINDKFYDAYNNLARLYIVRHDDFASALTLLNTALEHNADRPKAVQYSLLKNRGWAHVGLKYYGLAEADLEHALRLRPDGAAAHCLLAQMLESPDNPKGDRKAALTEWEACLGYVEGEMVEAEWLGLAKERLSQGAAK